MVEGRQIEVRQERGDGQPLGQPDIGIDNRAGRFDGRGGEPESKEVDNRGVDVDLGQAPKERLARNGIEEVFNIGAKDFPKPRVPKAPDFRVGVLNTAIFAIGVTAGGEEPLRLVAEQERTAV